MMTKLVEPLKREIEIDGVAYTLTITPQGLTLWSRAGGTATNSNGAHSSAETRPSLRL